MPPYAVMRADLSGTEDEIGRADDAAVALMTRDGLRFGSDHHRVHYRVLDADDTERGEIEWDDAEERLRSLLSDLRRRRNEAASADERVEIERMVREVEMDYQDEE